MANHFYARQFDDEEEGTDNNAQKPSRSPGEPGYQFEGFSVELNEKVMLTPVTKNLKTPKDGRNVSAPERYH